MVLYDRQMYMSVFNPSSKKIYRKSLYLSSIFLQYEYIISRHINVMNLFYTKDIYFSVYNFTRCMAHAILFPENLWKHVFVKTSLSQCLLEQITLFYSVNINKASNILLFFPTSICFKSKVVKWFTRGPLFPVFYLQTIEAKIL